MAAPRKPQARKLKFELTRSAVAGIGVVVFCLFLWMFLFGVWAGQSLLMPSHEKKNLVAEEKGTAMGPLVIRAEKKAGKAD
jgi:hypothetical protein